MDPPNPSTHPETSHPYPPSYRSPPHQLDYQRRRDERQNHHLSVSDNPYIPSTSSSPDPSYHRPTTRLQRSASESSTHPALPPSEAAGNGKEYPDGWTKEDEDAEREFLKKGMFDWKKLTGWRFWIRKEWWYWYILLAIGAVLVILMSVYHDQIVDWMTPFANWMKDLPAGWTIPIAIFFVLSFPPLFGQEILAILVGVVWGLWVGFGITAAGTLLGEIGNFYAFKYCLRSTAAKYEKNNFNYATMAHVVREGGFWMIFVIRFSAIPGPVLVAAVFATCGVGFWVFTIATILTLPKQLIVVYLGVIFANDDDTSSKEKWISNGVLIFGVIVTIWAGYYIYKKMNQARIHVWRKRRMEAASRGVSLNPLNKEWDAPPDGNGIGNGNLDRPTVNVEEDDDVEARSPILNHRHGHGQGHQSYQNPYDISYQSQNNMSIYQVDPSSHPMSYQNQSSQSLGPKVEIEQDISYAYRPPAESSSTDSLNPQRQNLYPTAQFPEARSTGLQSGELRREKTSASGYTLNNGIGYGNESAQFPVPLPASNHHHVDHGRDHPHVQYGR
ncbi:hypothetical protein I302_107087 [Kwoniella bestiolae CBS 10118]|uniref:Golgi apparatus membrane protein TVP38 n=1 Tax=Kwoniella bestiolae CBS 10118 TaxID=1296100 RepID=A0A1B9FZK0_9TREE|nr:hypothetical protein I302_05648 [Kwoniella bestiolae CBS 10118]OCF24189.1 hypothetical protein I302_05648 [Kwoniella bestiolae CBS 10118]